MEFKKKKRISVPADKLLGQLGDRVCLQIRTQQLIKNTTLDVT